MVDKEVRGMRGYLVGECGYGMGEFGVFKRQYTVGPFVVKKL